MMRPYKFQVVATVQEVDDDGKVVNEHQITGTAQQAFTVFGVDGLKAWADAFTANLAAAEQAPT